MGPVSLPDPVLGFHGPGTAMWRVNREAVLLAAGQAALLLQIAHPHVAEGVAQHSDFEADPWRRLRGTLRTTLDLVFGDGPAAERAVRRLNAIHARVKGDGYHALDPALLLWVQATLVVTGFQAYERWVGPLDEVDEEELWQDARRVGQLLGIPLERSPADRPALAAYWTAMLAPDGPIRVTPTARRLAATILRPPLPLVPGAIVDALATPGLALLPPHIRAAYGVAWGPGRAMLARTIDRLVRSWVRLMPASWRAMPQARTAERRARRPRLGTIPPIAIEGG
jgi:uncharacterized protein (DUF2236 family)